MHIKIKSLNDQLYFIFDEKETFYNLMQDLKSLLERPMFYNDGFFPKAFFDFQGRILKEEQLQTVFDILFSKQSVLFMGISGIKDQEPVTIKVMNRTIHSGEVIHILQDALIIGHINPGAIVTFTDKLYVLGTIRGMVEGIHPYSSISGQSFKNAHVRINGVSRHDYTSLQLTMLYYKDNEIYLEEGEKECLELL